MKITNNDSFNFIKVEPDTDGNYITKYKENDDIEQYYATTVIYVPKGYDYNEYHEISKDEHNKNLELQKAAFEEKSKELMR